MQKPIGYTRDENERLRAENERLRFERDSARAELHQTYAEIERLRDMQTFDRQELARLVAEIERLRSLKTPASRQLLNLTKGMLEHAEEECERLRAALERINRTTSSGTRTLDDFIRDMGWANDTARAAIAKAEKP
jgi:predicted  nucleic acid-binding Zn-ribbon protein